MFCSAQDLTPPFVAKVFEALVSVGAGHFPTNRLPPALLYFRIHRLGSHFHRRPYSCKWRTRPLSMFDYTVDSRAGTAETLVLPTRGFLEENENDSRKHEIPKIRNGGIRSIWNRLVLDEPSMASPFTAFENFSSGEAAALATKVEENAFMSVLKLFLFSDLSFSRWFYGCIAK